jgi:hypothetical protein
MNTASPSHVLHPCLDPGNPGIIIGTKVPIYAMDIGGC